MKPVIMKSLQRSVRRRHRLIIAKAFTYHIHSSLIMAKGFQLKLLPHPFFPYLFLFKTLTVWSFSSFVLHKTHTGPSSSLTLSSGALKPMYWIEAVSSVYPSIHSSVIAMVPLQHIEASPPLFFVNENKSVLYQLTSSNFPLPRILLRGSEYFLSFLTILPYLLWAICYGVKQPLHTPSIQTPDFCLYPE